VPFSLPPLDRRGFISATLAAGAALVCRASRGDDSPAVDRWALLADTHIDASPAKINKDYNMADHLVRVVGELPGKKLEQVLVLGDLAFLDGQTGDYELFGRLIDPARALGLPVHLALGNHDHRQRFQAALERQSGEPTIVEGKHLLFVKGAVCNWVILDSLYKTNVSEGEIGKSQLAWLAKVLRDNAETPAVVAVHHPPQFENGKNTVPGIQDTSELWPLLVGQRHVKAVFFGHTHDWQCREKDGIHLINLPPVSYPFKNGRPLGWVEAEASREGMQLTLRSLDTEHPQHREQHQLVWRV
jgi:3',5'-cyclic AMP phosphodiesterase CpdA